MLFCAACQSKSCAARMDKTKPFRKGGPGRGEKMVAGLRKYEDRPVRLMAALNTHLRTTKTKATLVCGLSLEKKK